MTQENLTLRGRCITSSKSSLLNMQSYANVLQSMQNTHAVINRNQQYDRYKSEMLQEYSFYLNTGSVCRVIVEIRIYTGHSKDVLDKERTETKAQDGRNKMPSYFCLHKQRIKKKVTTAAILRSLKLLQSSTKSESINRSRESF